MIRCNQFRKLNQKKGEKTLIWDYSKLRGKIREICGTQDSFAEKLGIGRVSLSQRLNNQLEFSQDEIFKACEILGIKNEELSLYFFCLNSSEN